MSTIDVQMNLDKMRLVVALRELIIIKKKERKMYPYISFS